MNIGKIAGWVGAGAMTFVFAGAGIAKLFGANADEFARFGYPLWFLYVTGTLEAIGAALVLVPKTRALGGALLATIMVGAIGTHLSAGDPLGETIPPLVFMSINIALAVSTLRVPQQREIAL